MKLKPHHRRWLLLVVWLLWAALGLRGQANTYQKTVFEDVFAGISTAQSSTPLRNIGQYVHLVQVTFPAETTTIAGLSVRLEWSPDGVSWRPAGPDINIAYPLAEGVGATDVIAYGVYYGVFRSIRVRNALPTPGGELMTVRYIANVGPAFPFITLTTDRWEF